MKFSQKYFFLLFLFLNFFPCFFSFSQLSKIDSLINLLKAATEDSSRLNYLLALADEYKNIAPDSSVFYAIKSISVAKKTESDVQEARANLIIGISKINSGEYNLSLESLEAAVKLSEKIFLSEKGEKKMQAGKILANSYYTSGKADYMLGSYENAIQKFLHALEVRKEINDKKGISDSFISLGAIYWNRGNYPEALKSFFDALKVKGEIGDSLGIAACYNNIGEVYRMQNNMNEALKNYFKSAEIQAKANDSLGLSLTYNNIGNIYHAIKNIEESLKYHLLALNIRKEIGDKPGIATSYNNIGLIYHENGNYNEELKNHFYALKMRESLEDKNGIAMSYINIGDAMIMMGNFIEAQLYLNKALELAKEISVREFIISAYQGLAEVNNKMNNHKKAYEYHMLYADYKDSLLNEESSRQIAEMQTKYETEKKDAEIQLLNKDKEIQTEEIKRQKIFVYSAVLILALVVTLSFFIYRSNKQKQLANLQLERKNSEIMQSKLEIENKNNALENANSEITKKKKEIEEKNEEVLSSIRYAKRIQQAVLKAEKKVTPYLPDHFVLFKPKDIVSGDFYWACEKNVNGKIGNKDSVIENLEDEPNTNYRIPDTEYNPLWYVAAADCTGHGVPGAFLTMLGMSFLNEITSTGKFIHPSEILDELRNRIIKELGQTGKEGERWDIASSETSVQDGMDISLISLNLKTLELEWSGANNPMYVVAKNENTRHALASTGARSYTENNLALFEIKADKQPIGYFPEPQPFTNHKIQLKKSDSVFIFSDGYADQFGGPKGKKFKYSQLEKLILSVNEKPMEDQKSLLINEIEKWMENHEQIDDICMIGIKI